MEGDEPALVVIPFEKYRQEIEQGYDKQPAVKNGGKLEDTEKSNNFFKSEDSGTVKEGRGNDDELLERLNQEIESLKEEIRAREIEELD